VDAAFPLSGVDGPAYGLPYVLKAIPWAKLAAIARGGQTGIALSHCAVGGGVNADNIRECLRHLHQTGYTGHLSIECEGQGGPLLTQSLQWLRTTLAELGIP
jgi:inosose dehydratase